MFSKRFPLEWLWPIVEQYPSPTAKEAVVFLQELRQNCMSNSAGYMLSQSASKQRDFILITILDAKQFEAKTNKQEPVVF